MDAEQVIAAASIPSVKPFLPQALGGSEADLDRLVGELQHVVPPEEVSAVQGPAPAKYALGALKPTPETGAEIRRSARQAPVTLRAVGLSSSANFSKDMPPIREQGARGTCVAFAVTAMHEFHHRMSTGERWPGDHFSEQFLFHETRLIDGYPPNTCGTWIRYATSVLSSLGQCLETVWPYNPALPCTNNGLPEPANARADAAGYKLTTMRVSPDNNIDVDAIKASLSRWSLVAISFPVYNSWYSSKATQQTGFISMPLPGEREGVPDGRGGWQDAGHALCVIGYQEEPNVPGGGFFILRNSWGTNWGWQCPYGAGNGTMPYAYITNYGWEAWAAEAFQKPIASEEPQSRRASITIESQGRYDIVIR